MNEMNLDYVPVLQNNNQNFVILFCSTRLILKKKKTYGNKKQKHYNFPINSSEYCLLSEDSILRVYCDESVHSQKFKVTWRTQWNTREESMLRFTDLLCKLWRWQ